MPARDELQRRLVHASGAAAPLAHVGGLLTYRQLGVLLLAGSVLALVLEAVRLLVGLDWAVFERLTREYERDNVAGYALYVFSMTLVAWAFPARAAIPGMLMLAVADPVSGLLGSGELRQVKQGWVLFATFGVATLLAAPFVSTLPAVCGGAAATVADGVKPVVAGHVIDDNLTIPPAAAVAIEVAVRLPPLA